MKINLQGQLATTAETRQIEYALTQDASIAEVIMKIGSELPSSARDLLLTPEGEPRSSLFIALNSNHLRDTSVVLTPDGNDELTLMPPMAGG